MSTMHGFGRCAVVAILWPSVIGAATSCCADDAAAARVTFVAGDGRITVKIGDVPVADYVYQDPVIPRPYFAHVRSRTGIQVTRNHPPIEGQDLADHGTFHPGIWLAFGDINGSDYWRNKVRVEHAEFVERPRDGDSEGGFAVRNRYQDPSDAATAVCKEIARYKFTIRPDGYLLLWDSTFSSEREIAFGDQEEMGLGFRVATPLRVEQGGPGKLAPGSGTILDSEGRRNGSEVAGKSAAWCDYSGTLDGQRVGMTLLCHPANFRPSWFHARDYGLLVANPFGRQSLGKGEPSSVVVRPGETLRLRYGILIHSGSNSSQPDWSAAYRDYVRATGK